MLQPRRIFLHNARKQPPLKRELVSEVVEELLSVKREKGRSFLYLKDLRLRLERVAKAFPCPLADVTSQAIDKFLLEKKDANTSVLRSDRITPDRARWIGWSTPASE